MYYRLDVLSTIFILFCFSCKAQTNITVVLECVEPFVNCHGASNITGFGFDLWNRVLNDAFGTFYTTQYIIAHNFTEFLSILRKDQASLGIRGLAVTNLEKEFLNHSISYHDSIVRAAILEVEQAFILDPIGKTLASKTIWEEFAVLLWAIILISNLIWYVERKENSINFRNFYPKGALDGLYWAGSTTTTVGYGDVVPVTSVGRCIAIVWMMLSYFGLVIIAGTFSSLLVVNQFRNPPVALTDIQGEPVAVIRFSQGFEIARKYGSELVVVENYIQAAELLTNSSVVYVLGAQASLSVLNYTSSKSIQFSGLSFSEAYFAFALSSSMSPTSDFVLALNEAILMFKLSPLYDQLQLKYTLNTKNSKPAREYEYRSDIIFMIIAYFTILVYMIAIVMGLINSRRKHQNSSSDTKRDESESDSKEVTTTPQPNA